MFGRGEKLKRLEAENKLAHALEEAQELRKDLKHRAEEIKRLSHYETEAADLHKKINELGGKIREQTEADLLMASCKIIKALVIDEKPKSDPRVAVMALRQQAAYNSYLSGRGNISSCYEGLFGILGPR